MHVDSDTTKAIFITIFIIRNILLKGFGTIWFIAFMCQSIQKIIKNILLNRFGTIWFITFMYQSIQKIF